MKTLAQICTGANIALFSLMLSACGADRMHAKIGLGYAVDREAYEYAVAEWHRASGGRVTLEILAEDTTAADYSIGWEAFQPVSACAYTNIDGDFTRLQLPEPPTCAATRRTTALHELGIYLGADHESTNPDDVMYPYANTYGIETLTPHDVAIALDGAK
jgi:hypothetical protein